jgi:phage terminase large subunit-like protein
MSDHSLMEILATMPEKAREQLIEELGVNGQEELLYSWDCWKRPKQGTPEGDWRVWLIMAGRGFGKTRTGAEFVREQISQGKAKRVALVGATAADVRDTMIEGESGLLSVFPPHQRPRYEPSKRRVTFHNGATATAYSADEPDRLRGPNHDLAWADELAAWRYPEAWDQLMFGLRLGDKPRVIVTTTPRPIPIIRRLTHLDDGSVSITRGSTYENATNLADDFLTEMRRRYEGTRLGRQELFAEILDDVDGALWNRELIERTRQTEVPPFTRITVAIDPAVTSSEDSAETGIIVAGYAQDRHGYVLADKSMRGSPNEWAKAAIAAYHTHNADVIVAEANQGGDMVKHTLATIDSKVPVKLVRASRGKRTRAEPVASLYEQGQVHHIGYFGELEDQLCSWVPDIGQSPDRLDALVWALTDLMIDGARVAPVVIPTSLTQQRPWI